jgi:hypothetical protein
MFNACRLSLHATLSDHRKVLILQAGMLIASSLIPAPQGIADQLAPPINIG